MTQIRMNSDRDVYNVLKLRGDLVYKNYVLIAKGQLAIQSPNRQVVLEKLERLDEIGVSSYYTRVGFEDEVFEFH